MFFYLKEVHFIRITLLRYIEFIQLLKQINEPPLGRKGFCLLRVSYNTPSSLSEQGQNIKKTWYLKAILHITTNIFLTKGFLNLIINLLLDKGTLSCFNPPIQPFLCLKQQIKVSLIYVSCLDLKNTIFYCPEALQTSKNKMKKVNLLQVEKYLVQGGI